MQVCVSGRSLRFHWSPVVALLLVQIMSWGAVSWAAVSWAAVASAAEPAAAESFFTTEVAELGRIGQPDGLDPGDIDAVFAAVFHALDDAVTVRPSENYYFFRFLHDGVSYSGNLRLDAADRDRGTIHYRQDNGSWPRGVDLANCPDEINREFDQHQGAMI